MLSLARESTHKSPVALQLFSCPQNAQFLVRARMHVNSMCPPNPPPLLPKNVQPWTYVVVADPAVKKQIREIVEAEERVNYERRMGQQWVNDLSPLVCKASSPSFPPLIHLPLFTVVAVGGFLLNELSIL